jgi:hypothetical protein
MSYKFTDADSVKGNWFKFTNVGDNIQGTYINKRSVISPINGNDQNVYELKLENGEIWNVGSKPAIDEKMRNIKFGQIIEFKLIEIRPSKKAGLNAAKIIQVFANSNVVDKEWLLEQESLGQLAPVGEDEIKVTPLPASGDPVADAIDAISDAPTAKDIEAQIISLGASKFNLTDANEIKTEIMTKTGLAFIEGNYPKILEALKAV